MGFILAAVWQHGAKARGARSTPHGQATVSLPRCHTLTTAVIPFPYLCKADISSYPLLLYIPLFSRSCILRLNGNDARIITTI